LGGEPDIGRTLRTVEEVWDEVRVSWGGGYRLNLVWAQTFVDLGMEPMIVLVYDRLGARSYDPDNSTERRVVIYQGGSHLVDTILNYQEGW
jgi:hypothetical protein